MQKIYRSLLLEGADARSPNDILRIIGRVEKIFKKTRMTPEEKDVQAFYARNGRYAMHVDALKKLEKLSGIPWKIKEAIQERYKELLKEGDIAEIYSWRQVTQCAPVFDEAIVQSAYHELLRKHQVDKAMEIYRLTEIDPFIDPAVVEPIGRSLMDSVAAQAYKHLAKGLLTPEVKEPGFHKVFRFFGLK